jgi:hypothetical protein
MMPNNMKAAEDAKAGTQRSAVLVFLQKGIEITDKKSLCCALTGRFRSG